MIDPYLFLSLMKLIILKSVNKEYGKNWSEKKIRCQN